MPALPAGVTLASLTQVHSGLDGLNVPAGTPPAILAKLEKALSDVLAMPDVRKRLTDMGAVVKPLQGKEFDDYIRSEITKWADIVKKAGVTPE